jgi:hypothetical protein
MSPLCPEDYNDRYSRAAIAKAKPMYLSIVMPGLVPGIHVFKTAQKGVDGRNKFGHDTLV